MAHLSGGYSSSSKRRYEEDVRRFNHGQEVRKGAARRASLDHVLAPQGSLRYPHTEKSNDRLPTLRRDGTGSGRSSADASPISRLHDGESSMDIRNPQRRTDQTQSSASAGRPSLSSPSRASGGNSFVIPDSVGSNPANQMEVAPEGDECVTDFTLELDDEEQEQKRIAEQRLKRQRLLEKYREEEAVSSRDSFQQAPAAHSEYTSASSVAVQPLDHQTLVQPISAEFSASPPQRTRTRSPDLLPRESASAFDLAKTNFPVAETQRDSGETISAADYDPSIDRREDEARQKRLLYTAPKAPSTAVNEAQKVGEPETAPSVNAASDSEYEDVEVENDEDVDDMFAVNDPSKKKIKVIRVKKDKSGRILPMPHRSHAYAYSAKGDLIDNWDDTEGYYRIVLGERIGPNSRYHVFANLGKGMFSEVVRARDLHDDGNGTTEVAIKVVRSQETMYKAGIKEIGILKRLAAMDPDDRRHIVRLKSHFQHRGHLCMVFESLSMNLREIVKRFGKDVGLNLRAVRAYTYQIFLGLDLMKKASLVHADLKPDNILVNEAKTVLKICDLGSAAELSEMDITPYLASRFYRAPEVILGQSADCAIDVWSIGCTLYELYTGKILFPGRSCNQMLLLIQELKGKFTTRQIRKGRFSSMHFDETNTFLSHERDRSTGIDIIRRVAELTTSPTLDLRSRLLPPNALKQMSDEELRLTQHFIDLLSRTLELDPAKRITPADALKHPFLL